MSRKKKIIIFVLIAFFLFLIIVSLPFVIPCILAEKKYRLICFEIKRKEKISKERDFVRAGKKIMDYNFFKKLTILIIIWIFLFVCCIILNWQKYFSDALNIIFMSIKYVYDFVFNHSKIMNYVFIKLNFQRIFFICYIILFLYLIICLSFINMFGFFYLKKYWNKNFEEILTNSLDKNIDKDNNLRN